VSCVMHDDTMVAATRSKAVERDGRLAVVRTVPVLVCESCGEVYLDALAARQLDVLFRRLLNGPVDEVVGHYEPSAA